MSFAARRIFHFTESAVIGGHSIDYIDGDEIVLHIKPNHEKNVVVVNDFRNGSWGEELLIPFVREGSRTSIDVEIHYNEQGVKIGLSGQGSQAFDRCGDVLKLAVSRVPNSVQEVGKTSGSLHGEGNQTGAAAPSDVNRTLELRTPRAQPPDIFHVGLAKPDGMKPAPLHELGSAEQDDGSITAQSPEREVGASEAAAAIESEFRQRNWKKVVLIAQSYRASIMNTKDVVTSIGRAYIYLGKMQEAERELRWLERHAPTHHGGLFYLGVALANLQRYDEARLILEKCVSLQSSEPKYLFELARVTTRLVNGGFGVLAPRPELIDDAIELLERAAVLMPRDGRPHRDLGGLLLQKGMFADALEALDEARHRSPHLNAVNLERARVLVRLDRVEEALWAAQEAAEGDPANDAAASTVRILERWLEGRRSGVFKVGLLSSLHADANLA